MTRTNQIKKLNRVNRNAPEPEKENSFKSKKSAFVFSENLNDWIGKKRDTKN